MSKTGTPYRVATAIVALAVLVSTVAMAVVCVVSAVMIEGTERVLWLILLQLWLIQVFGVGRRD